ncbi:hypothetical protein D0862_12707 [Hortaea werneckii]|uniref:CN hydrolase domain-containing protein n=1 Tax=Hortaea werneckii TaxID=91943 RepID=A0A3M7EVJ1_HORWE|nr:hypothetical protein D0862_12707 [Hortaea werneckii]
MIVIMNKIFKVFLIAFSIASTTSGQASHNVSPFVMISNEPIRHTNLSSKHNDTASAIQQDLIRTLSHCEPQQYILLPQFGLQPEDIQNVSSMPKVHGLIHRAAQAVVIPYVSGIIDCMSIATSALKAPCDGSQQQYYDAWLESIDQFCECESCVPWSHDVEREGMLVRVPHLPYLANSAGDEEERRDVLRQTARHVDVVGCGFLGLTGTEQMIILPFTSPPYSGRGSRTSWCLPPRTNCRWGREDQKIVQAC